MTKLHSLLRFKGLACINVLAKVGDINGIPKIKRVFGTDFDS